MTPYAIVYAACLSIPGIGRQTILKIFEEFEKADVSPVESWGKKEWMTISKKAVAANSREALHDFQEKWSLAAIAEDLAMRGVTLVSFDDQEYPDLLRRVHDFPLVLFAKGNLECLRSKHVAVVGSRRPTRYGHWATQHLVSQLVDKDVSIVSGFMVGIDYQAHSVAQVLGGRSVGVLGFGFDYFYPSHLQSAAASFLEEGQLLVTEYPPRVAPSPGQFAARNRIVAGMSAATLVVEAQQKSGSLITAQCALDNDRVVGAVPGPIDSKLSEGTNQLIHDGAILVQKADDLLEEFSPGMAV